MTPTQVSNETAEIQKGLEALLSRAKTVKENAENLNLDSTVLSEQATLIIGAIEDAATIEKEVAEIKESIVKVLDQLPDLIEKVKEQASGLNDDESEVFKTQSAKVFEELAEQIKA